MSGKSSMHGTYYGIIDTTLIKNATPVLENRIKYESLPCKAKVSAKLIAKASAI